MGQPKVTVSGNNIIARFGGMAQPNGQGALSNVDLNDQVNTSLQDLQPDEDIRALDIGRFLYRGRGAHLSEDFGAKTYTVPIVYYEDSTHFLGQLLAQLALAGEQQLTFDLLTYTLVKYAGAQNRRLRKRFPNFVWDIDLEFIAKSAFWQDANPTGTNLLTVNQASLETNTTGWVATTNCAISSSATFALDGTKSLLLTSTIAGDMQADTLTGLSAMPVVASQQYTALAFIRAGSTLRSCQLFIRWWKSDGTASAVRASDNVTQNDAVGSFPQFTLTAIAPSDAAYASLAIKVLATGAGAELHYVDEISLAAGSSTTWAAPVGITTDSGTAFNLTYAGSIWCEPLWMFRVPAGNPVALNSIVFKNTMASETLTVNFLSSSAIPASTARDVLIDSASMTATCIQTGESYDVSGSFPNLYQPAGQVNTFTLGIVPASGASAGCTIAESHFPRWLI